MPMTSTDRRAADLLLELLGEGDASMTVTRASGVYTLTLLGTDSTSGLLAEGIGGALDNAVANLTTDVRICKSGARKAVAQDARAISQSGPVTCDKESFPINLSRIVWRPK